MLIPKFVYIVIATAGDHFAEMAAVSMQTLRLTNPSAHIVLLTNQATAESNQAAMQLVRGLCNDIIVEKNEYEDLVAQSRYLKLRMRDLVEGDFIYLDSDTLILGTLDALWEINADFAACLDEPTYGAEFVQSRSMLFNALNWTLNPQKYINFGVALMRDTLKMREFCQQLFVLWQEQVIKTGKYNDQFVLNHLLCNSDIDFKALKSTFNAQITANPMRAIKAKIMHVFTGAFDDRNDTVLHVLAKRLKQEGRLDMALLNHFLEHRDPWVSLDTVRKLTATKHYVKAAALYLKKTVMQ